ncbi:MAG: Mlr7505 protein [uncultured Acidimicrobiales bacterium]|uniref:Mlr7505 protein n=1 Tax=uncultured Acidimicrobiales bacterium TaxID=310071 RepID=A0A6J4IBB0_9ACTN|nr:MAG: Mlr7505 protein [uncultured Acidimicrobiales bacterium]
MTGDEGAGSRVLRYVTHPEVAIDPETAVGSWRLSSEGVRRAEAMCRRPWVGRITRIVSSDETKAVQTAEVLAAHTGVEVEVRLGIGENDRSATGFVPPARFEQLADRFFAEPEASVEGWERAVDAQLRIVTGLRDLLSEVRSGDVAVIGHGGVGTLWYCALAGLPIDRRHDQPHQGHYFTVDRGSGLPTHGWQPIDRGGPG